MASEDSQRTLQTIGEDFLIQELTQQCPLHDNVVLGPGDDCAVVKTSGAESFILLKTDSIIEGVHYLADANPYYVGWKAAARVVSDFAAMGGRPDALMVALAFKQETPVSYLEELYKGIRSCAETFQFSIVGGETSSSTANIITVSGTGKCDSYITRKGASPENHIYVTGKLGGSLQGKHLNFTPRLNEAIWLCKNTNITAMMDLSDGIAKDLPRLADQSSVGFELDFSSIPITSGCDLQQAISDGEDYELLFTTSTRISPEKLATWERQFPDTPLTHIGVITDSIRSSLSGGWEHFKKDTAQ